VSQKTMKQKKAKISCRICHMHPATGGKLICERCEVISIRKEKR